MPVFEEGKGVRRPPIAVFVAWVYLLVIAALGYWGFAFVAHIAHRKQQPPGVRSDLARICDGGAPRPASEIPSEARCRWLFDWWHWPAVVTVGVVLVVALTVVVALRRPAMVDAADRDAANS